MNTPPLLLLVDGSGFLFRAYHALPPLSTHDGHPTGAIRGTVMMLKKLLVDFNPAHIAVIFDAKGPTFRHHLYTEYKAHRPPMPDELRVQIEPLHHLITALGLPLIIESGVEADDVIGSYALAAKAHGWHTLIASSDKDLAQLVCPEITLFDSMKNRRLDEAAVIEKFGVPPNQIVEYLALMGDSADNIPGIDGVGPKTAAKWLQQFGSLQALIDQAEHIKGKAGEKLRAGLAQLPLSLQLTQLKLDHPLPRTLDQLIPQQANIERLKELYSRFEFKGLLKELDPYPVIAHDDLFDSPTAEAELLPVTAAALPIPIAYETILTLTHFEQWLAVLSQAPLICIDTETDRLNYMQAQLVGISFAIQAGHAAYLPLTHDYLGAPTQLDKKKVLNALKPLLENPNIGKVGQHLKYDWHIFYGEGIVLRGIAHDSQMASYVLNPTATRHNMDDLAQFYLQLRTTRFEEIAGKGTKQLSFNQIDLVQSAPYAAEDADITLRLHNHLTTQLQRHPQAWKVYQDIEIPLIPVLAQIEQDGVKIDTQLLHLQSTQLAHRLLELEQQAHQLAGGAFNLSSPKQLQEILFERLQIPVLKKTPTGQPSTNEEVLSELALNYELPRCILEHRSLAKLKSTYTDKLPEQVDPKTGRVHTSYHQAVTSTGRLSSSDPNLQNIPIRTPEGRRIRQAFIAETDHLIVAADYSQIELRLMAHFSGDTHLIAAFLEGKDIHRATAAEVFDTPLANVSDTQRRAAKAINFGLIYGMGAFGLARQLSISRHEAQDYIARYFARYPAVLSYMEQVKQQAHVQGYVETLWGRRLYLPELTDRNASRRAAAERLAINAPLQGTAADIIKRAMLLVSHALSTQNMRTRMIMQVHDELVFEAPQHEIEQLIPMLHTHMGQAAELSIPLTIDVGTGNNWDQAH